MQLHRPIIIAFLIFVGFLLPAAGQGTSEPKIVSFPSGNELLKGYLWVPPGEGPFAAVVWNYGHKQRLLKQGAPSQFAALAKLYLDRNYVFFIPDRAGNSEEDGKQKKNVPFAEDLRAKNHDLISALSWLRQQSFVIATKVAVSGTLAGGVQALLAAERDSTLRAVVIFSPGAGSWTENAELRSVIQRAAHSVQVPIFIIQPQNDPSLGPIQALGLVLSAKGGLNRTKVYLPYGNDPQSFAKTGMKVWGEDVLAFLDAAMR